VADDTRSDAALVALTPTDERAFGTLVRRSIRQSTLLATQLLGDADEAEDVVQEAFTIVYERIDKFDRGQPFPPWLYGIVRRLAGKRRERAARRSRLLSIWRVRDDDRATDAALVSRLHAEDRATIVYEAMTSLPPMQRACFDLVVLRDLPPAEAAAMHGITESTVRQHVFRAKRALRAVLVQDEVTDTPDGEAEG
jgi:RNA polymerase sigma-70 factor (ECF subfamily)